MKRFIIFSFFFTTSIGFSQVGINTTSPSETLEVNGTLKINTTNQPSIVTTKLGGISADGVFRSINIGSSLKLSENTLQSSNNYTFGAISPFTVKKNHNVDLLIGSGEANEFKTIIRIYNTSGNTEITGIQAGTDGQHIWLYPQDDKLTLKDEDDDSIAVNRIGHNNKLNIEQYEMVELVYDGTRSRWIIMQHN